MEVGEAASRDAVSWGLRWVDVEPEMQAPMELVGFGII